MSSPIFITRLTLRNYKSIAACRLTLGPLTFLVGPNGSGKSNCLDSLRLVAESLRTTAEEALRKRGGADSVVRRCPGGRPDPFAIRLDFCLPSGTIGYYSLQIGSDEDGNFEIQIEESSLVENGDEHFYRVENGEVADSSFPNAPPASIDRLYLVVAAGLPEFRPLYDALSAMEVYNLDPQKIGNVQRRESGEWLQRDGGNAASVLKRLPSEAKKRVDEYLSRIVRGVLRSHAIFIESRGWMMFDQAVKGREGHLRFLAESMSDGALRAFGLLLALFQDAAGRPPRPLLLVGLEEPETGLHPAASAILLAALREASATTQVIVTSHSTDLLDDSSIQADALFAVDNEDGVTHIAPVDEANRSVLEDKLFTPGELLRQNQLAPDPREIAKIEEGEPLQIFGPRNI